MRDGGKEPERALSPASLDPQEAQIVADALGGLTPRTSYYAEQPLEPDVTNHFHDTELCVLLHQEAEDGLHDLVKKALRKAVRQRVKKLGMKYDAEVQLVLSIAAKMNSDRLTDFFYLVHQTVPEVLSRS